MRFQTFDFHQSWLPCMRIQTGQRPVRKNFPVKVPNWKIFWGLGTMPRQASTGCRLPRPFFQWTRVPNYSVSLLMESHKTRNLYSDFWGVSGARSPSHHFSFFSIESPTSIPPPALTKELRKLTSLKGLSMNPDSHCKIISIFNSSNLGLGSPGTH